MGEGGGSSSNKFINPNLGIVRSWQGIVELVLRGVTIVSLMKCSVTVGSIASIYYAVTLASHDI